MLWRLFPFSFPSSKLVDNIDLFRGEIIWNCYIGAWRNSTCITCSLISRSFAFCFSWLSLLTNSSTCLLSNWMVMCRRYERFIVTFPVSSICTESMSYYKMRILNIQNRHCILHAFCLQAENTIIRCLAIYILCNILTWWSARLWLLFDDAPEAYWCQNEQGCIENGYCK